MNTLTPLKAIRKNCLQCTERGAKYVAYCPCDGKYAELYHLWPYRFGIRPQNVNPKEFVTPGALPGPNVLDTRVVWQSAATFLDTHGLPARLSGARGNGRSRVSPETNDCPSFPVFFRFDY